MVKLRGLISLLLVVIFSLSIMSCEDEAPEDEDPIHECVFGEWQTVTEPTFTEDGVKTRFCADPTCDKSESEPIPKLIAAYYIKVKDGENETDIPLLSDGIYTMPNPIGRAGYAFEGWFLDDGSSFSASGTVSASVTVNARYTLLDTTTFAELKSRIEGGADRIRLVADITLTDTIYVVDKTTVFTSGNYTLKRADDFLSDLFVLGCDSSGFNVILGHKRAELTFKPESGGSITVDGNKSGVSGSVSGTAFFLKNSSILNVHDGVSIINCKKTANGILLTDDHNISSPETVGGAAAIITNGVMNMYGGTISGCEVNMNDSAVTAAADQTKGYDNSSRGGAIFNYGTFSMYGGTISGCKAGRGGVLYNYRIAYLRGGKIDGNETASYGGVAYQPNSQYVYSVIGDGESDVDLTISNNKSGKSGGVMYVSHLSVVYIKDGVKFYKNEAISGNGGAINAAGTIIMEGGCFEQNSASSKGGAIYAYYDKADMTTRIIELRNGKFLKNSAPRGGAVALGAGDGIPSGAIARIGNVTFEENYAPLNASSSYGYGGALHIDSASSVEVYGSAVFTKNKSDGNGGAIYATKSSTLNITAKSGVTVLITENSSDAGNGGAIYNSASMIILKSDGGAVNVTKNESVKKNGGAIAVHSGGTVKLFGATLAENSANEGNGGALYVYGANAVVGDDENRAKSVFKENTAEKGGAIYVSSSDSASTDFDAYELELDSNEANGGGGGLYATLHENASASAVSCTVDIAKVTATNNHAGGNGGAMYLYTSVVANLGTVEASGNEAENASYGGGVMYVSGKATVTVDSIIANGNSAYNKGGCIYLTTKGTKLTIRGGNINGNTADTASGGNAIWVNSSGAELNIMTDAEGKYLLTFTDGEILGVEGFAITKVVEDTQ